MKKICLVVPKYIQNNQVFDIESKLNRDDIFDKYIQLKKELAKAGSLIATNDIHTISESDAVIYLDMPSIMPSPDDINKSYLILAENALIRGDNYDKNKHKFFKKIFTWNDELVDNDKYYKLNYSHKFPSAIPKELLNKTKLCILISANKTSPSKNENELYSKRIETIRWFESNHPKDFDLYGIGWDKRYFKGFKLIRALNRLPFLGEIYAVLTGYNYPSYKGAIKNKQAIMAKYKFSICYENLKDVPGYITEKIFDSFFSGCVPIYWGSSNVNDYIPLSCFIDRRSFETYEHLYDFINTMSDDTYINYLYNIEKYLQSDESNQFTCTDFARKITSVLMH